MFTTPLYPYHQVFFDTTGKMQMIQRLNKTTTNHVSDTVGDGIISFLSLDLSNYKSETKKLFSLNIDSIDNTQYQSLRNTIFDIAELLKDNRFYLFSFLIGTLNRIVLLPIRFEDDMENKREHMQKCIIALNDVSELQKVLSEAVRICLDKDILSDISTTERYLAFSKRYTNFRNLTFQTGLSLMPQINGKLDYTKSVEISNLKIDTPRELLQTVHKETPQIHFLPYYRIETFEDMLFLEVTKMLEYGFSMKQCEVCGKYFVIKDKRKRLYCERIYKDEKTCRQIGGKQAWKKNIEGDIYLKQYKAIYEKMVSRYYRTEYKFNTVPSEKDISPDEYFKWLDMSIAARKKYISGEISGEELIKMVDRV